jgi:hypothetical protein
MNTWSRIGRATTIGAAFPFGVEQGSARGVTSNINKQLFDHLVSAQHDQWGMARPSALAVLRLIT